MNMDVEEKLLNGHLFAPKFLPVLMAIASAISAIIKCFETDQVKFLWGKNFVAMTFYAFAGEKTKNVFFIYFVLYLVSSTKV